MCGLMCATAGITFGVRYAFSENTSFSLSIEPMIGGTEPLNWRAIAEKKI